MVDVPSVSPQGRLEGFRQRMNHTDYQRTTGVVCCGRDSTGTSRKVRGGEAGGDGEWGRLRSGSGVSWNVKELPRSEGERRSENDKEVVVSRPDGR